MTQRLNTIRGAFVITVPPPPVRGIGNAGGFKMMIQDRGGQGLKALEAAATQIMIAGNQTAGLSAVFTLFNTSTPKLFAEIDRVRAQSALSVIKQHPGMVLFAVSPALVALAVVWWFFGAGWAALLLVGVVLGGGAAILMKRN